MLESGVDLKTVSPALGHSTIRITADTYAHVTPAMQQSAADRLDRILAERKYALTHPVTRLAAKRSVNKGLVKLTTVS